MFGLNALPSFICEEGRNSDMVLRARAPVRSTKGPLKYVLPALCLASCSAYAFPLGDTQHGFSLDVPAGYVRLEDSPIPGALHVCRRDPIVDGAWGLISLTPLSGTISQRPPIRSVVEASAKEAAAKTGTIISRFQVIGLPTDEPRLLKEFEGVVTSFMRKRPVKK